MYDSQQKTYAFIFTFIFIVNAKPLEPTPHVDQFINLIYIKQIYNFETRIRENNINMSLILN